MSYDELKTGDLAITANGVHVVVYVGNGKWIQADPGIGLVATLDGRTDENSWFDSAVNIFRWKVLAESD